MADLDDQDNFDGDDEELVEELTYLTDPGQEAVRIDKFLMMKIGNKASRNKIQQAIKAGSITVNEAGIKANYKIRPNDRIRVIIPKASGEFKLEAEDIPLHIVHEDEDVIVLNKQAGLVVHPGVGNYTGTLVNALLWHYKALPFPSSEEPRPGLVHRIDKDTSGLMVVAKTDFAMTHLANQFFKRTSSRTYQALVWGNVEEEEGRIEGHIGRNERHYQKMDVFPEGEKGKEAITNYRVIQRFGYVTLVECKLETGRTHQIRIHMKHLGHPLFNDEKYGGDKIVKGTVYTKYKQFVQNCFKLCPRQALHAKTLGFKHPTSGEAMLFDSELPEDMQQLIEKWDRYTSHIQDL